MAGSPTAMNVLWEIALQTVEILTLLIGIVGMIFSTCLLLFPDLIKIVSNLISQNLNIGPKLTVLDKYIRNDEFIYKHHVISGIVLIGGSVFTLVFLFFELDPARCAQLFFASRELSVTGEIFFHFAAWIGKMAGFFGIILGIWLLAAPEVLRKFERFLNAWFSTQPVFDRLDTFYSGLDSLIFRHAMLFGLLGLALSILLIFLASINLIGR
jgi:hypothetical protein